jgi:hypothetical protein
MVSPFKQNFYRRDVTTPAMHGKDGLLERLRLRQNTMLAIGMNGMVDRDEAF